MTGFEGGGLNSPSSSRDRRTEATSTWQSDTSNFCFLLASLPLLCSAMTLLASERSLLIRNKFRSGENQPDINHAG
ncbi:hypothetical protein ILYODFUR_031858 [Ilyodon furcidens]|uniref:Uncharacterized protein n=1 Tax=Ilyodon furcidens TaxID=33524 RepID=A0ABV0UMI9_9TELE